MRKQSFNNYLFDEITSIRMALIPLYEQRDKLLYVEAPSLRKKYMSIFGEFENEVLKSELETSLLRRKIELIQTAINRREPIDLDKIESQIQTEREQRLAEVEEKDATLNELPQLSEEQLQTLQGLYHDITEKYHPALHSDLTDVQKELYQKALDAYKRQNVDELQLIHDCLFEPGYGNVSIDLSPASRDEEEERKDYRELVDGLSTDYTLAKDLYPFFAPTENDTVIMNAVKDCDLKRKEIKEEISKIKNGFPFNAVPTMEDNEKTEEYRAELRLRLHRSEAEKMELLARISELTEERANG